MFKFWLKNSLGLCQPTGQHVCLQPPEMNNPYSTAFIIDGLNKKKIYKRSPWYSYMNTVRNIIEKCQPSSMTFPLSSNRPSISQPRTYVSPTWGINGLSGLYGVPMDDVGFTVIKNATSCFLRAEEKKQKTTECKNDSVINNKHCEW